MKRVTVLKGGMSSERDVSLVSGAECAKALREEGFDVTEIDVAPNLWEQLHAADPDVIFNALHGDWGEDGRVQGVLDLFGAPYSHSGVMASALAMDKHRSKSVLRDVGITVSEGYLVPRRSAAKDHPMEPPYVVKPNGQGSSHGIYIVKERDNPAAAMADNEAMGGKAIAVTEIIPNTEWYDYEAKYADGGSRHVVPAEISKEATELCLTWAALAHQALGCRGISRSDFRFNDINDDLDSDIASPRTGRV